MGMRHPGRFSCGDASLREANIMRNNIDILLGILTWIIAASVPVSAEWLFLPILNIDVRLYVVPPLWLACLCLVFCFRKRPARRLWWVWFSAPVALYSWLGGALLMVLWGFGGFAP